MRRSFVLASVAATMLMTVATRYATADVYEPNDVQSPPMGEDVPYDSSPEVQLSTMFSQRGETLDEHADAHITPNTFSPLCGFTATFVLNQAGNKFGLAWYNDTGSPPQASDLHEIVPAGATIGTMVSGATIRSDPNYTGGLVGFALEVDQASEGNHDTNAAYSTVCTDTTVCSQPKPWILALMYASTVTANAYYICFEDGATSSSTFGNDGDFNDDVFFLTGITCSGGLQPCNTGLQGICAAGLTQCSANGTTCQQQNQPTPEVCNGLDDDCNGMVDDDAPCPTGEVCQKGTCVQSCQSGEFPCPSGLTCNSAGYCVDPACVSVTCPSGEVCVAGTCKGPCDGITCPYGQVCSVGTCVDPCKGVSCASGQVCTQGVCVASCDCQPCATGTACDAASGNCVDPTCVGVTCAAGTHCAAGACSDDCAGAVCPTGETCSAGSCVASMTSSSSSSSSGLVFGTGGSGGATGAGGSTSGSTSNGSTSTSSGEAAGGATSTSTSSTGASFGAGGSSSGSTSKKSGCGCRVAGMDDADGSPIELGAALAAIAGLAASRRRRSGNGKNDR